MTRADPITAYAQRIVAGIEPAGKYHKLACARHLKDLQRAGSRAFPYVFSHRRAQRFFNFAQRLKHYRGQWAGRFIVLQPHQKFRLGSLFGWIHPKTRLRRFRTSYNELPRKQGKSLEAAVVALYVTFFDDEAGVEGYCMATKREQAKIVFTNCKKLVESSGLRRRINVLAHNLHNDITSSKLMPLGADYDSTDGLNPNLIIADELQAYKNRDSLDVMETATGAREEPINFQITTAGSDPISPCGDQHDYACKILDGILVDETFFAFIAHADPDDDWLAEATWRKANPNFGVSVLRDDLVALSTKAANMPAAAAAFKQKRLNLWVNADAPWLSMEGWRRGQTKWTLDDMAGQACWIGIDLSSKIDLTAVVLVFPPTEDRASWRLWAWCLTPADTLPERARRDRAPYPHWKERGYLRTNPGNRIDQSAVAYMVHEADQQFDVQQIGVDPWNAGNLTNELTDEGFEVIEIPQTLPQLSAPAKDFEADVLDGLVDAAGNELMTWCISNVVVQSDNKDNIFPTKKRSRGRIDPVIAALMGRKLAAGGEEPAADDPVLVTV